MSRVVKIDLPNIGDLLGMHSDAIRHADVVIAVDNTVLKDRDGFVGRAATRAELDEAELLRRY
jgi:hypothetical protein